MSAHRFHPTSFEYSPRKWKYSVPALWNCKTKPVCFMDEKNVYLNPPACNQNNCVWAGGHKADIEPHQLLVEWDQFASRYSVGRSVHRQKRASVLCGWEGEGKCSILPENLWPKLVEDCEQLLPNGFIFQQDGTSAHPACVRVLAEVKLQKLYH